MLDSFEEGDFADCCRGHAIVLLLQPDLLQCDHFACHFVPAAENHTVSALAELVHLLVAFELLEVVAELLFGRLHIVLLIVVGVGPVLLLHFEFSIIHFQICNQF